ncbi:energy-coupling factor transporter transmembrane protein EcfT [Peptococcaceae bacterium CEB3]|nr:energy-coupling factor transporter transmembrane protein EcfT [Peptococcaceae bacterium CEB3]
MAELNIFHYTPQKSIVHTMDGRIKLLCMILFTIAAGLAGRWLGLAVLTAVLCVALTSSKLPAKSLLSEMRYFLFLSGIVIVVNSFTVPGAPITGIPIHGLTWQGFTSGLLYAWRLLLIVLTCTILTGTTPLSQLKNAVEWYLRPIPLVPEARIATMFSLTLVLIPLIFDQAAEMLEAQKARCIEKRKNPLVRIKFLVFPLLLHTFMRADEMVLAMESRCYSEIRTKQVFRTTFTDWLLLIFTLSVCSVVLFTHF